MPPARFAQFLDIARQAQCLIKMVVTDETTDHELREAFRTMSEVTRTIPLVLQPLTPINDLCQPPDAATLLKWQALAKTFLDDVRIIPQCHKLVGLR